jgi:hypothetical protein
MKQFSKYIYSVILFLQINFASFSQTQNIPINEIERYISFIDSLISIDHSGDKFVTTQIEGTGIEVKTNNVSHSKIRTLDTIKYGWSRKVISNLSSDTVYKIKYHDNLNANLYLLFYLKDNKLLYSQMDLKKGLTTKILFCKKIYYHEGKAIKIKVSSKKIPVELQRRVKIEMHEVGIKYLNDFFSYNSR